VETSDSVRGLLLGYLTGNEMNKQFESLPKDLKEIWKRIRPMHHGDFGYLVWRLGIVNHSSYLAWFGIGLMLSDLRDIQEWTCFKTG